MAIKAIRFRNGGDLHWGVVDGDHVKPIDGDFATTGDFVRHAIPHLRAGTSRFAAPLALADVDVEAPITANQQFLCQAINYHSHMRESGIDPAGSPFNIFFTKAPSCLAPPDTDIVRPPHVACLDYEVEIGLVFARDVTGPEPETVTAANLHEYVAALVLVNDVSARDVQLPEMQFYKGKSYRTFGPTGPYLTLVDAAELARFDELVLRLWVNEELRQSSPAADMVHKPVATLNELFSVQDVNAGDLLATGTPGGCALQSPGWIASTLAGLVSPKRRQELLRYAGRGNGKYLEPGDRVEARIATEDGAIDLGTQRNLVVGAAA